MVLWHQEAGRVCLVVQRLFDSLVKRYCILVFIRLLDQLFVGYVGDLAPELLGAQRACKFELFLEVFIPSWVARLDTEPVVLAVDVKMDVAEVDCCFFAAYHRSLAKVFPAFGPWLVDVYPLPVIR